MRFNVCGKVAFDAYAKHFGDLELNQNHLGDLIIDLMHLGASKGFDVQSMVNDSKSAFRDDLVKHGWSWCGVPSKVEFDCQDCGEKVPEGDMCGGEMGEFCAPCWEKVLI